MMQRKISDEEAQQIIEADMPEYQLVEHLTSDARAAEKAKQAQPDAVAPAVDAWREKTFRSERQSGNLGEDSGSMAGKSAPEGDDDPDLYQLFLDRKRPASASADYANDADVEDAPGGEDRAQSRIVVVKRKGVSNDRSDVESEAKGVIIDGKTRKVIGYQG